MNDFVASMLVNVSSDSDQNQPASDHSRGWHAVHKPAIWPPTSIAEAVAVSNRQPASRVPSCCMVPKCRPKTKNTPISPRNVMRATMVVAVNPGSGRADCRASERHSYAR